MGKGKVTELTGAYGPVSVLAGNSMFRLWTCAVLIIQLITLQNRIERKTLSGIKSCAESQAIV
jgi:hypothetical protein